MSGPYHRPFPRGWFLKRRNWSLFLVRELTSVFIGAYLVVLLVFLARLGAGRESFYSILDTFASPGWRVFHGVALVAALWHSVTWFNLTPQVMPVRLGTRRVPDVAIALAVGYVPWVLISMVILFGAYHGRLLPPGWP